VNANVLIVGGGPVGLTMAADLHRFGIPVRIVEKAAQRTDKSKALVIWSRTMELLDRLHLSPALPSDGMKVFGANITSGKELIAHLSFEDVHSTHPYGLMIPQSETERLLEEHLNSHGVTVDRNVELTAFRADPDGVVSTLRSSDGRLETFSSSWLIGCDGAHSTVRHLLGMDFIGDTMPSNWILADLHLQGVPRPEEISVAWHSSGVLALFPMGGSRFRVVADIVGSTDESNVHDPAMEEIQAVLDQRGPGGITASQPVWLAGFHINERKVPNYRSGRVFLAGDAAHIHSPAGGQGMNTGMQDAFNLAWKLALVCRGTCAAEPLLDSYNIERGAVGEAVLAATGRITMLAILQGGIKQSIRNHLASAVFGLAPVREKAANAMTEISIGYRHSPLNGKGHHVGGGPAEGERAPIREGASPVGEGDTPRFTLFADHDEGVIPLLEKYGALLDPELRPPLHPGGLWLVRPDGYIALATKQGAWQEVANWLDRIAIPVS
jgi:2-polyprenyl-6-methoxyphenol hydroxylase-like FAD-dependent oxidoreductase